MKFPLWLSLILLLSANLIFSQKEESEGTFSGHMFGDYFYNINRDTAISSIPNSASSGKKDLNGFQIRKIYFTYDADISKKFASRFRLDAGVYSQKYAENWSGRIYSVDIKRLSYYFRYRPGI